MPVKITVVKGKCQGEYHEIGDSFTCGWKTPEGICLSAWTAIAPYVMTLLWGGDFDFEKEKGMATLRCPDPKGIVLELRRVEKS